MISKLNSLFKNADKKLIIYLFVGLGILLLGFSSCDDTKSRDKNEVNYNSTLNDNLEKRLEDVLSKIDGVGKCDVIITYESSVESILATDKTKNEKSEFKENGQQGSKENDESVVLIGSGSAQRPMVVKEFMPQVRGVVVVAEGGGSVKNKQSIIEAIAAVTGVSPHNIGVFAAKTK